MHLSQFPQGCALLLWNFLVYFSDLQIIPAVNVYADDCTLWHTYSKEKTQDVIEFVKRQAREIENYGDGW